MLPKKQGSKIVSVCSCGYSEESSEDLRFKESVPHKEEIAVVESEIETLPECDEECPKCGNKKAYYWMVQTRAGDEPETKFLKCAKCKHRWRDYD